MKRLIDCAKVLRSKNAGPLCLTIDMIFNSQAEMKWVLSTGILSSEVVAKLYDVPEDSIRIIPYDIVNAIKVTLPRQCSSGDLDDEDVYGCQQHVPLAELMVPEETI